VGFLEMIKFCNKCQSDTERYGRGECKPCTKASQAAYRTANPEKRKAANSAYRAANPEKVRAGRAAWYAANLEKSKAWMAAWYASNKEKAKADNAKWHAANPDKGKAYAAAYRAANPEKRRAIGAAYRAANPERNRQRVAAWSAANPERHAALKAAWAADNPEAIRIHQQNRRARKLENGGTLSKGLSAKLFNLQRGKCPCCNKPLGDDFHLDHITPLARGGSNTDNNIQLLRASCNRQKSAQDPVQFMQQRGFLI